MDTTITEIVIADYRAASILANYGIDFCRSGRKTLAEICREQHLDPRVLETALTDLNVNPGLQNPHWYYHEWDIRFLVNFITYTHHHYIRRIIPELLRLGSIVSGAATAKPVGGIQDAYALIQTFEKAFKTHLDIAEKALFPYILNMDLVRNNHTAFVPPEFGRIDKPIRQLEEQHSLMIDLLEEIRYLTDNYRAPAEAAYEQRSWYGLLKEFDADMHLHLHLENNILFPKAIALEAELLDRHGFTTIWFG